MRGEEGTKRQWLRGVAMGVLLAGGCMGGGGDPHPVGSIPLYDESWACVESGLAELGYATTEAETDEGRPALRASRGDALILVEEVENEIGLAVLRFRVREGSRWDAPPVSVPVGLPSDEPGAPPPSQRLPVTEAEDDARAVGRRCTPA